MTCNTCNASYDENGVCPSCGAKQPKGKGYRIGHSILCCLLTVLLTVTLVSLASARSLLNGSVIDDAVKELDLATLPVGRFVGAENPDQNLAGYLLDTYVTDSDITEEEVATMISDLGAESLLQEKTDAYLRLFRGTSNEIPQLSSAEIIELLENNENKIFTTFAITIEESDKEMIAGELDPIMNAVNDSVEANYGSKFSRSVSRFWLSMPCLVILLVLNFVVMIRWCVVYKKSTGAAAKGVRAFSISALVPSAIFLLCGAASLIFSASLPDSNAANNILITLFGGTGEAVAIFGGISLLVSIFLLIFSKMLVLSHKPAAQTNQSSIENSEIVREAAATAEASSEPIIQPQEEPIAPIAAEEPISVLPHCPNCGKEAFKAEQKFCMRCGAAMQTAEPQPRVSLEKEPDPVEESEPIAEETAETETTVS